VLQNKYARILTVVLLAQAALFYATSRGENVPVVRPLRDFPHQVGGWTMVKEGYVDEETQAVLKADDTLIRFYARSTMEMPPSLFVAFFKTQRTGKTPHSPKNCLPGSGWEPSREDYVTIAVPGVEQPIEVNRYMVSKGEERSAVLYWYQHPNRVVASEYRSKFFTVADAIRYNRTDMALVRVVVPVRGGDEAAAQKTAVEFVQSIFTTLHQYLSS
jgi:EpsI family protein